jgi:hypothetical protein
VHDASLVRRVEGLGNLLRERQSLATRDGPARDPLREVFALDELHDERRDVRIGRLSPDSPPALLHAIDLRDMRVIERRECPCFTLEALAPLRIGRKRVGQNLQRDIAAQPGIATAVHLAHTARP